VSGRIEAALEFAELGARIVPARGKNPGALLGKGWQHKASRDPKVVRRWFSDWPTANVGALPDGAFAPLDVDDPVGLEALARVAPVPETPRYLTGGAPGRARLLFAMPDSEPHGRTLVPGVQLRHGALLSIVPPGIHPDTGAAIEWTTSLDEVPLAQLPGAWLSGARAGAGRAANGRREYVARDIPEGERHETLLSIAGHLVARRVDPVLVLELVRGFNATRCAPPSPQREVDELVIWIAQRELGS
jgi:Bifunctional DNA primase/polymerase, N-terminal/Primase C terminal 1 (PriCT-1)